MNNLNTKCYWNIALPWLHILEVSFINDFLQVKTTKQNFSLKIINTCQNNHSLTWTQVRRSSIDLKDEN